MHEQQLTYIKENIDAVVIDNFYSEEHLEIVLNECTSLIPLLLPPSETSSATGINGEYIKNNYGAFIDENSSKIVSIDYDVIRSDAIKNQLMKFNSMYKIFRTINTSSTLISYYTDGDYYGTHTDKAIFTMLVWVYKEPKQFSGGDIVLESVVDSTKATIECINNRAIIFPSATPHSVTKVSMPDIPEVGRFCITHFLNLNYIEPKHDSN